MYEEMSYIFSIILFIGSIITAVVHPRLREKVKEKDGVELTLTIFGLALASTFAPFLIVIAVMVAIILLPFYLLGLAIKKLAQ